MSQIWFTSTPVCVFVDHAFLRAQCLRSILQHVSPLTVGGVKLLQSVINVTSQNLNIIKILEIY